jgi:hypothetical protein
MSTQITEHFTKEDLERSATASAHKIDNSIPDNLYYKAERLCKELEDVRTFLGEQAGEEVFIYINSGYRCPELNSLVHGQPTSQHMALEAVDFHCSHYTPEEAWTLIKNSKLPYDQLILEHDANSIWCHYSVSKENAEPRHMAFKLTKV